MKKTLIALLSILLIAFAFTACDNGNKGPAGPTEEEQKAADELATEYMNSINYGELIVQAFDGNNTSTLKLSDKSKTGFRIEFTDYKGSAIQKVADSDIASIASGAIDFVFSTAPADSKAVITYDTYEISTVEDKPLVFEKADGTAVGGSFTFTIAGDATISFETASNGNIETLTVDTTVSIKKPETAEIMVGKVEVAYDTIKDAVNESTGATVKDPFTTEEAEVALAAIVDSVSKENLKKDIINGLNRVLKGTGENVKGVKFDSLTSTYKGQEVNQETTVALLKTLLSTNAALAETATDSEVNSELLGEIKEAIEDKTFNVLDLSLILSAHFETEEGEYYTSGLHTGTGADGTGAVSKVESIDSGNITIKLYPSSATMDSGISLSGLYSLTANNVVFAMTDAVEDEKYTVSFSDLTAPFSLGLGASFSGDIYMPEEGADIRITVSNGVDSPSVSWADITLDDKTAAYATEKDIQADAKAFYQHFGTKRFLIALGEAFEDDTNHKSSNGLAITIPTDGIAIKEDESVATFNLKVAFDGYQYHTATGNQLVNGTVDFIFTGTVEEGEPSTFKATDFKVSTTEALNLSDDAGFRPNATVSFAEDEGTIGSTGDNGNVTFTVEEKDGGKIISGINDYSAKDAYSKANEFVLTDGIENVEITF